MGRLFQEAVAKMSDYSIIPPPDSWQAKQLGLWRW